MVLGLGNAISRELPHREREINKPVVEHRLGNEPTHKSEELSHACGHARTIRILLDSLGKESKWGVDILLAIIPSLLIRQLLVCVAAFRWVVTNPKMKLTSAELTRDKCIKFQRRTKPRANLQRSHSTSEERGEKMWKN